MTIGAGKTFDKAEWKNEYAQAMVNEWLNYDKDNEAIEIALGVAKKLASKP